jgi:sugar phosphate permease
VSQAPVRPPPALEIPVAQGPASRVRFLVVAWACALAVVTYLHRVGFSAIAPDLLEQLHLDDRALGYFMAAFMIAYGALEVPWGLLGDTRGGRSALMAIVIGGSLVMASVATVVWLPDPLTMGLSFLIVARFLLGAFQAGTFPVLARIMADWIPTNERGGAQGAIWMASRFGGAIAPIVMISLLQRFGDWRLPLVLGAGLGLAWCAGFWAWFRNSPDDMPGLNAAERELIASGRRPRAERHHTPWSQIFGRANPLALCAMYACLGYSGNFFLFLMGNYLETKRHFDKNMTMWLTSLPLACGVFACAGGGILSDLLVRRTGNRRWGRRIVGVVGMLIAAIGIVSMPAVTNVYALALVIAITAIGNDLTMGPAWAAATEIGERSAGTLGGTMNMAGSFAAALAGVVTGDRFARGDLVTPFLLFALWYVLGALCWLRIDVTEPLTEPRLGSTRRD